MVKKNKSFKKQVKKNLKSIRLNWDLYVFLLLPGVLWYLFFAYKPMTELRIAFYDYNLFQGIEGSKFVGLKNFITFVSGSDFFRVVKNTFMLSLWQLLIGFPIPILLAISITEMKNKVIRKLTQTATLLPHFISTVVACGMVVSFTSPSTGVFNMILGKFGVDPIYFMVEPDYFRGIFTGMHIWQNAGFNSLVFVAAIVGIDPQLYEAATVDGAGKLNKIIHVTIPGIIPTIVTMFVLQVGRMVKVGYEAVLLLYQPSTYSKSDVISTYAYRIGFQNNNYGLGTAVGLFEGMVALVMVVLANKASKKISDTALW